jgi:hypothetical protein
MTNSISTGSDPNNHNVDSSGYEPKHAQPTAQHASCPLTGPQMQQVQGALARLAKAPRVWLPEPRHVNSEADGSTPEQSTATSQDHPLERRARAGVPSERTPAPTLPPELAPSEISRINAAVDSAKWSAGFPRYPSRPPVLEPGFIATMVKLAPHAGTPAELFNEAGELLPQFAEQLAAAQLSGSDHDLAMVAIACHVVERHQNELRNATAGDPPPKIESSGDDPAARAGEREETPTHPVDLVLRELAPDRENAIRNTYPREIALAKRWYDENLARQKQTPPPPDGSAT